MEFCEAGACGVDWPAVCCPARGRHAAIAKARVTAIIRNFIFPLQVFDLSPSIIKWEDVHADARRRDPLNSQGRSQLRRTVCREEIEDGGEGTAEKRVPEALRGPAESAFGIRTDIFAAVGFSKLRGAGMPCESRETVPQRRSGVGGIEQLERVG